MTTTMMDNSVDNHRRYYYHHRNYGEDDEKTTADIQIPQWMIELQLYRKRLFLRSVEPMIELLFGPSSSSITTNDVEYRHVLNRNDADEFDMLVNTTAVVDSSHRRLGLLPSWVANYTSHQNDGTEGGLLRTTSMSFATLTMMYIIMLVILLVFLSCFYHNQKTSPLFVSPRRHRLPKLVPPPLPVNGAFSWVKVCLLISDEEVS